MTTTFDQLFIFEMANNHQGDLSRGVRIIDAIADIARRHSIRAAIKFQFRDLDTFIHPAFRERKDVKHIGRFLATRLSWGQFKELANHARAQGLLVVATPFDEVSVDQCLLMDVDMIKVASCSCMDWPLLGAIAATPKPVIISVGGLPLPDTDKVVSFFRNHHPSFALMHCVGVYPTPDSLLHLDVIHRLQRRYPDVPIGYSGHERPADLFPSIVAVGKGARLLERHVGVESADSPLNAYSMNPQQVEQWVEAVQRVWQMSGTAAKSISGEETQSLRSLMRGTYARRPIPRGKVIGPEDVYFAMPLGTDQLSSGAFGSYRTTYVASRDYAVDEPITESKRSDAVLLAREFVHEAMGMLNEAGIHVGEQVSIELSHHYGIGRLREVGAIIITHINREYCKKIIVMVPGQNHPVHRHERKEETFVLLSGDLQVRLEEETIHLRPGDTLLVKRNTRHSFHTQNGAIFEEISTTHYLGDSFYDDAQISALDPMQRKTILSGDD
ncbi:MAG: N-acetylneuraminate synthase family protein [Candidatus Peregrinibacteria bacterium]